VKTALRRLLYSGLIGTALLAAGGTAWLLNADLPFRQASEQAIRIVIAKVGAVILKTDIDESKHLARSDYIGDPMATEFPFVFERSDAPHLVQLRKRYDLQALFAGAPTEYEAQLQLAAWVGTRFEHGDDDVPGGRQVCDPVAVFDAGSNGRRFWCEIAAYSMIQAATAVGWPARMITASLNGYRWDHAVAELWSNQFNKWFVIDTDFNIVFEVDGVPLSAWELVHKAPALRQSNQLVARRFAKFKEGLAPQDVLRLFQYTHVDMRNDWCTRDLLPGSPAGGDLATRWTARSGREPKMTAVPRADTEAVFDWKLNNVSFRLDPTDQSAGANGAAILLSTHSPVFSHFEIRKPGGEWVKMEGTRLPAQSWNEGYTILARVVTLRGDRGPSAEIKLDTPIR
jgi:hypothetical protein